MSPPLAQAASTLLCFYYSNPIDFRLLLDCLELQLCGPPHDSLHTLSAEASVPTGCRFVQIVHEDATTNLRPAAPRTENNFLHVACSSLSKTGPKHCSHR